MSEAHKAFLPLLRLARCYFLRLKSRHLHPLAPAYLHMEIALGLADCERNAS